MSQRRPTQRRIPRTSRASAGAWMALVLVSVVPRLAAEGESLDADKQWGQWRGPLATGEAPHGRPPVTWSETQNLRFKVAIPGRGHGTPVIWGNQLFITSAVPTGRQPETAADTAAPAAASDTAGNSPAQRPRRGVQPEEVLSFDLLALDRNTGEVLWQRSAQQEMPHEGTHPDATWASASAVTDGQVVVAPFGSRGIYAYSMKGEKLWGVDLGDMRTRRGFGEGSSPVLGGGLLVVNWDHEDDSFIVALDKMSGQERWRRQRDEPTSWSTPVIVSVEGKEQVIVAATDRVRGYELHSGEVLWEVGGMTLNTVPTPFVAHGMVYATSGFRGNALRAIRLAGLRGDHGDGDLGDGKLEAGGALAWSYDKDTPYVPSAALLGERLYFLKGNQSILSCLDAKSGKPHYGPVRLPEIQGVYASPVAAAGRVYIAGRDGMTVVLEDGPQLKVVSTNTLDEGFDASPAIVGDTLYLRGREHLYALAQEAAKTGRQDGGASGY